MIYLLTSMSTTTLLKQNKTNYETLQKYNFNTYIIFWD